jgi:ATP-binding cassette subfamily B protein
MSNLSLLLPFMMIIALVVLLGEDIALLDPENEALIQGALAALVKDRTALVIAQRLRTTLGADR